MRLFHLLRVCQYPWVPLSQVDQLPEAPGVYYAMRLWQIEYIGMSKNLRQRWTASGQRMHDHKQGLIDRGWIKLHYRLVSLERVAFIEALEIQRFQPSRNTARPSVDRLRPRAPAWASWLMLAAIVFLLIVGSHLPGPSLTDLGQLIKALLARWLAG